MDAWSTARAEALWNHEYSGTERPRERQECRSNEVLSPLCNFANSVRATLSELVGLE